MSVATARVSRQFAASSAAVSDAWLEPDAIRRWFGPGLGEVVHVAVEARVGGAFAIVQRRGDADVEHVGVYLEVVRPERLAFTWSVALSQEHSSVTLGFQGLETGCLLTLTHEMPPEYADFVPKVEASWMRMLEAMDILLTVR